MTQREGGGGGCVGALGGGDATWTLAPPSVVTQASIVTGTRNASSVPHRPGGGAGVPRAMQVWGVQCVQLRPCGCVTTQCLGSMEVKTPPCGLGRTWEQQKRRKRVRLRFHAVRETKKRTLAKGGSARCPLFFSAWFQPRRTHTHTHSRNPPMDGDAGPPRGGASPHDEVCVHSKGGGAAHACGAPCRCNCRPGRTCELAPCRWVGWVDRKAAVRVSGGPP